MSQNCRIQLLGNFRILINEAEQTLRRTEARRILGFLALHQGRHCSRAALVDLLDRREAASPEKKKSHLSVRIHDIRQILSRCGLDGTQVLRFDDDSDAYCFGTAGWSTDVGEFRRALARAASAPSSHRIGALLDAVRHYTGPLLPDWDDLWITSERIDLARQFGRTLHELILRLCEAGDYEAARHYTRRLLEHAPEDPEGAGERARVLLRVSRLETTDRESEPGRAERISAAPPDPRSKLLQRPQSTLPVRLDSFIGRADEFSALLALLQPLSPRLISVVGPPGAGKTRLAIQAAHSLAPDRYPGGRYFVDLRSVEDPHLIVPRLFRSLGLHRLGNIPTVAALAAELGSAPTLVVLDNWEQLTGDGDPVLLELLETIPALKLLLTSRRRSMLPGERLFELGPLRLPAADADPEGVLRSPAGALFVDRARQAEREFLLTQENAAVVTSLCRRLDGIPLALELMAREVRGRGVSQVLRFLQARAGDKDNADPGPLDGFAALSAALETSYELLTPPRRWTFARTSVFRGSWDVAAARAILAREEVEEDLRILRDHSLLTFTIENSTPRYGLLETIREFADSRLPAHERQVYETAHAQYFRELAQQAARGLQTHEQLQWLDRLDLELDNLRAALAVLSRDHPEEAMLMAGALAPFWATRGYINEARTHLGGLLAALSGPSLGAASALLGAALIERRIGAREACLGFYRQALETAETVGREAMRIAADAHAGIAWCLHLSNQSVESLAHWQAAVNLSRTLGYDRGVANSLVGGGLVLRRLQQSVQAREQIETGIAMLRSLGDLRGVAGALRALGPTAYYLGDLHASRAASEEAVSLAEQLGDFNSYASALHNLAGTVEALGEPETAREHLTEALVILRQLRERHVALEVMEDLGNLAARDGLLTYAVWLWAGAQAERERLGTPLAGERAREFAVIREAVRSQLGASVYDAAWEAGRLIPWDELLELAISRPDQGQPLRSRK